MISYMQIYKDKMFDLLSSAPAPKSSDVGNAEQMTVTEDDNGCTYVKGLSCHSVTNEEEALNLLFEVRIKYFFISSIFQGKQKHFRCLQLSAQKPKTTELKL